MFLDAARRVGVARRAVVASVAVVVLASPLLGTTTAYSSTSSAPFGNFESAAGVAGGITVNGWAIDPNKTGPIYVRVRVDGNGTRVLANGERADVGAAFPAYGSRHGFTATLAATPGTHQVCITALNYGAGTNTSLGCRSTAVPSATPSPTPTSPNPTPTDQAIWRPSVDTSWQWQLNSATIDTTVNAAVYDVDGFEVSAATVASLHAQGRRAICYIDVGGWESYRPDAAAFPASVLGNAIDGWPEERWLDVRQLDVLRPIMAARFDMCRSKGFDAIEADIVETYAESGTGFTITKAQQLAYNRMLADLAHERGMSIGLKNAAGLVNDLVNEFDFAVVEECYVYSECSAYSPFVNQGKAVLHVEYSVDVSRFCPTTTALHFSSMRKHLELDAWRQTCP